MPLSPEESARILLRWNDTAADLDNERCLHTAVDDVARRHPDRVAVVHGDRRLTYAEIARASTGLARQLRDQHGVKPGSLVGVCLDRTPDLLVTVLGILKTGAAYVPLDPGYPPARLAVLVSGVRCATVVSRSDVAANLPGDVGTLLLDRMPAVAQPVEFPDGATPADLCYVIYTSGSTGAPKPIALTHRGVLNNLLDLVTRYGIGSGDSVLALSSPSFDMSVFELLGMTVAGATVVFPTGAGAGDPAHWASLLRTEQVTIWNSAPALLELLVDHLEGDPTAELPRMRLALLGGDWIPVTLPDRFRDLAPGARVVALGGATEASIHSTLFEVDEVDPTWVSIPYGRPMANQRVYVLDERQEPVPVGESGELFLAGTGLARGYLGQPERTAERFLTWSYGPVVDERLYRTGDLVRWHPDGVLELLGRLDFQVKINGLRVELGEIEAALRRQPGVRQAVVSAHTDDGGDRRLVGYLVPDGGPVNAGVVDLGAIRARLAADLPAYLVPAVLTVLPELPLSPNGKVDRRALPAPPAVTGGGGPPVGRWEQRIAVVWQEVLGVPAVGRDDDFFALGGDSMKAVRTMGRIHAGLSWPDIYRYRTPATLAARVQAVTS